MSEDIRFSPSQEAAIRTEGKTLIVSAGAGSGKTTVMTQRILEHVKAGTDVSDILVVTFTKAAAANMKAKLYAALLAESAKDPSNARLTRNICRISSAKISTVSSFCLDIVRSNFEALSLPPSVRVADEAEGGILLDECIEKCIDEGFESEDAGFIRLCDAFTGEKSLGEFKKTVKTAYDKYRAFPFWKDHVTKADERMRREVEKAKANGFMTTDAGKKLRKKLISLIEDAKKIANDIYGVITVAAYTEKNIEPIDILCDGIDGIRAVIANERSTYDDIRSALCSASFKSAHTKGLDPEVAETYKTMKEKAVKLVKEAKTYFVSDESGTVSDYESSLDINGLMNDFIFKVDKMFTDVKKSRGIIEFSDIEQYTLTLLGENTPGGVIRTQVCSELRENIKEIYIDEYQDINPIQDMIFRLLAKNDNRFMVGDVKQSIYRFRKASPDIFLGYLRDFGEVDSDSVEAKVFLSENYRSRKPILDFVNLIFDSLYTEENVGASYEKERLICGGKAGDAAFPVEVAAFRNKQATESEAEYIAARILDLVENKGYDYGDIAVLMRSIGKESIQLKREFMKNGIPFTMSKGSSFINEPEIMLALSILRILDDPLDDISLASSLRSPVFGFTADDLYSLKSCFAYDTLYDCVKRGSEYFRRHKNRCARYVSDTPYAGIKDKIKRKKRVFMPHGVRSGEHPNEKTLEKCASFADTLQKLRAPGAECPSSRMIWNMYSVTNLIPLCAVGKNGKKRVSNLKKLYTVSLDFERSSFKGLSAFLSYVSDVAKTFDKSVEADVEPGCVKLMTIHMSKGLEFPVCFVSAVGKQINYDDTKSKVLISEEGLIYRNLRAYDGIVEYKPLIKRMADEDEKKAIAREELRCLYVALTRAQERLIVTGAYKNEGAKDNFFTAESVMMWLHPILEEIESPCFELYDFNADEEENAADGESTADGEKSTEKTAERFIPPIKTVTYSADVFRRALEAGHADKSGSTVPSKASVSELRKGILEDDEYARTLSKSDARRRPVFASGDADGAASGTATHLFMQFADFGNVMEKGIDAEIARLKEIKMISESEADLINVHELGTFFSSPLCRDMTASDYVCREKRFNVIEDSEVFSGVKGEKVMVQGVIDCFFRNPDGSYTVVDYKTDRVKRGTGEETLLSRHSFQLGYYVRAVEQMTGGKVSRALLYSFCLGREIEAKI